MKTYSNLIDGTAHLLVNEGRDDYVARYNAAEMSEIFTADELDRLAKCQVVRRLGITYFDMLACTRKRRATVAMAG